MKRDELAELKQQGQEILYESFIEIRSKLLRVVLFFLFIFLGTFMALRLYIWDFLEVVARSEMNESVSGSTDIITRTPFEVILLQARIGLIIGIIFTIPLIVYYLRVVFRRRGLYPDIPVTRRLKYSLSSLSALLFISGLSYAFYIFFPFAFDFLASQALLTGVKPSFGITEFTEFIVWLSISFGLAAQLPLFMTIAAYTETIPYETFREKWKHAIAFIVVFGAVFSPPDPFTLIMWAVPLVILYVFSLGMAKLVTNMRRKGEDKFGNSEAIFRQVLLRAIGFILLITIITTLIDTTFTIHSLLPITIESGLVGFLLQGTEIYHSIGLGLYISTLIMFIILFIYTIIILRNPVYPRPDTIITAETYEDIDFGILNERDIKRIPDEVYKSMDEKKALEKSQELLRKGEKEKAQLVINTFDEVNTGEEQPENKSSNNGETSEKEENIMDEVVNSLDEGFDDDDIGGYYYDIQFILSSLQTKSFRIIAVFMFWLGALFWWLYQGGLGDVVTLFIQQVPEDVLEEIAETRGITVEGLTIDELIEQIDILIALHPVEVLIFIVKFSGLLSVLFTLPVIMYYAWPALRERGYVSGHEKMIGVWTGLTLLMFLTGVVFGFLVIAPQFISYLVTDIIVNDFIVSFRINSFLWLVFYLTIGIGILFALSTAVIVLYGIGLITGEQVQGKWRYVLFVIFLISFIISPSGIITTVIFTAITSAAYLIGHTAIITHYKITNYYG